MRHLIKWPLMAAVWRSSREEGQLEAVRCPNLAALVETIRVCLSNILTSFSRILDLHGEDEEEMLRAVGRRVGG
jgi:hypothetical protein